MFLGQGEKHKGNPKVLLYITDLQEVNIDVSLFFEEKLTPPLPVLPA